jgi:response regulator RpfG family c-di-GMP phosphodiesterase
MQDGLHRVGEGYVAMALQVVDGLERRHLAVPGHGERTARLAARVAERLGMTARDARELDLACRLVDLGKASIRPTILQKAEPLDEVEATSLRCHPVRAAEQLECVPGLRRVARLVRHQLERHDGKGAPDGLRGDRIPLGSRVLAVCAAFDLLSACAASRPLSWTGAIERLQRERGGMFDGDLVDLLADEVGKAPPTSDGREVLLMPTGVLPWRDADGGDVFALDLDDHDHGHEHDADAELEVLPQPAHGPEQG